MSANAKSPEIDLDDTLNFTTQLRRSLIDKLTADPDSLLKDKEGMAQTIALLRDLDGTALKIKRLDVDKKGNDNTSQALDIIGSISENITSDPFRVSGTNPAAGGMDASKLPVVDIIPGETAVGVGSLNYKEFMENSSSKS